MKTVIAQDIPLKKKNNRSRQIIRDQLVLTAGRDAFLLSNNQNLLQQANFLVTKCHSVIKDILCNQEHHEKINHMEVFKKKF
jgi:hypothetical protein